MKAALVAASALAVAAIAAAPALSAPAAPRPSQEVKLILGYDKGARKSIQLGGELPGLIAACPKLQAAPAPAKAHVAGVIRGVSAGFANVVADYQKAHTVAETLRLAWDTWFGQKYGAAAQAQFTAKTRAVEDYLYWAIALNRQYKQVTDALAAFDCSSASSQFAQRLGLLRKYLAGKPSLPALAAFVNSHP